MFFELFGYYRWGDPVVPPPDNERGELQFLQLTLHVVVARGLGHTDQEAHVCAIHEHL